MKKYIKAFDTPAAADGFEILDLPFITTVKSTEQNLRCTEVAKKLVNNNGVVSVADNAVTITGTWNPSATHNRKRVIISGEVTLNGKTDCYSLTFETGGHLTINAGARLRVWEGGITNDDCTTVNYLTIWEDAVNDSYGEFLLHPGVSVNNHPMASVKLVSVTRYLYPSKNIYQRFGIPTNNNSLVNVSVTDNQETRFYKFDYTQDKWVGLGYINPSPGYENDPLDITKLNTSFEYYQLLSFDTSDINIPIYTFTGNLYGNNNPTISELSHSWGGYANSFTGPIKTSLLLSILAEHNISSIQVSSNNTEINASNVDQWPYIQPIYCQFLILNNGSQFNLTLNYKDLVWDPSFEEETIPTRSLSKSSKSEPVKIDESIPGSNIFKDPESIDFEAIKDKQPTK